MELNKIYNENCLDTMARMPNGFVDLVVTSPPYNMRLRVRNGKYTTREKGDRALWGEMLRVIRTIRPAWVVGENVAGIISMELDTVLSDLESIGYSCQAFVIPACAVNALHRRDRVWVVAHTKSTVGEQSMLSRKWRARHSDTVGSHGGATSHADREREQQPQGFVAKERGRTEYRCSEPASYTRRERRKNRGFGAKQEQKTPVWGKENAQFGDSIGGHFAAVEWQPNDTPDLLRTAYGIPGRVDRRAARIKSLGNAIVPQVAFNLFYSISLCC